MRTMLIIDNMDSATGWAALGNDTTNLAASSVRLSGRYSLEFDKANGAANTVYAGAAKSISPIDIEFDTVMPHDRVCWSVYLSSLTNVANVFLRLGSSASNYLEWRVADTTLIAGWNVCDVAIGNAYLGGTGWNPNSVSYIAVGVTFDAEANELAGIKVDRVYLNPASMVRS